MKVTMKDVENVALLSRLEFPPEELAKYTGELNAFLEYAEVLQKVDTEGVAPTAHVLPLQNVLRPDEVKPSLPRELALANAPLREDGCFKVPKVVEG